MSTALFPLLILLWVFFFFFHMELFNQREIYFGVWREAERRLFCSKWQSPRVSSSTRWEPILFPLAWNVHLLIHQIVLKYRFSFVWFFCCSSSLFTLFDLIFFHNTFNLVEHIHLSFSFLKFLSSTVYLLFLKEPLGQLPKISWHDMDRKYLYIFISYEKSIFL